MIIQSTLFQTKSNWTRRQERGNLAMKILIELTWLDQILPPAAEYYSSINLTKEYSKHLGPDVYYLDIYNIMMP